MKAIKLLSAAFLGAVAAQSPSCKPWDAAVEKSISPGLAGLYKTFSPLAVMSPGLGSCLLENQAGIAQLVESLNTTGECNVMRKWLVSKPLADVPFQHANRTQLQAKALAGYLQQLNDTELQSTCTNTIKSVSECVMKQVIPAVEQFKTPCCAQWIESYNNPTLPFFTSNLIKHVSNILCSTQTIKDTTQSCGSAFVKAVIPPSNDMVDLFTRLSEFVVVPNDQGCAAQEGLTFIDTGGSNRSLFRNATPFSGCAAPLDGFVQWVKDLPYVRLISGFDASRLFANGADACVKAQKILPYLDLFLPKDKPEAINTINDLYDKKCAHLANGYAPTCAFKYPASPFPLSAKWPYPTAATDSPTTRVPAPNSPTPAPSSSASLSSSKALAVVVSACVFLNL